MRDKKEHFFDLKVTSMGYTRAGGLFVSKELIYPIFSAEFMHFLRKN